MNKLSHKINETEAELQSLVFAQIFTRRGMFSRSFRDPQTKQKDPV